MKNQNAMVWARSWRVFLNAEHEDLIEHLGSSLGHMQNRNAKGSTRYIVGIRSDLISSHLLAQPQSQGTLIQPLGDLLIDEQRLACVFDLGDGAFEIECF